jgi:hypothetical protein
MATAALERTRILARDFIVPLSYVTGFRSRRWVELEMPAYRRIARVCAGEHRTVPAWLEAELHRCGVRSPRVVEILEKWGREVEAAACA